jgi:preprotein translocase subunit SecD
MRTQVLIAGALLACGGSKASPTAERRSQPGATFEVRFEGEPPFLTSADLTRCKSERDGDQPVVRCTMTAAGASKLRDTMTANVGREFTISVDGKVMSRPTIIEPISGDQFSISLGPDGSDGEATELAASLTP